MHTKNKYGVVERLLDFGFLPSEIESVLIGVSNQRLVIDQYGQSKSFYDYALSEQLVELISTKGRGDTIEEKIEKLRQSGEIR
jgi:type II secretory ATPase GspE/PulE/Tfp pilus assembly ATPase PilB-like protein